MTKAKPPWANNSVSLKLHSQRRQHKVNKVMKGMTLGQAMEKVAAEEAEAERLAGLSREERLREKRFTEEEIQEARRRGYLN